MRGIEAIAKSAFCLWGDEKIFLLCFYAYINFLIEWEMKNGIINECETWEMTQMVRLKGTF